MWSSWQILFMKSNQSTFRDALPGLYFTFLEEKIILGLTPKAWHRIAMLLRYLSRVHFTEAKTWNVSLRDYQANGTNVIILQTREENGQYKYKRYRKQPIISNRGRPENSRPCGSSGDDSWFLTPANDPWAGRKKIEMRRQEDKESSFSATAENFPFIWRAINEYVSMDASISTSSSQRGPKNRALTLLFPARYFSLWHKPFMARETGASSQKCIKRSTVTFQRAKACQPLTVLPFVLHLSNGRHLAFPLWATASGSRDHASEKDFGPKLPHIFRSSFTTAP